MFYKRILPDADDVYLTLGTIMTQYLSAMSRNERAVRAKVLSIGSQRRRTLVAD